MVVPVPPDNGSNLNGSPNNFGFADDPVSRVRRRVPPENPLHLDRDQIQQDGAYIYREFLNNEFRRQNLPNPGQFFPDGALYHTLNDPPPNLSRALLQLRILSEEFSRTPMRQWVAEQAARVPLDQIDFQTFSQLLYGLFQEGGVTWERIVVLFYFCTDLAARAVRESVPLRLQCIVDWSFRFFSSDRMIQWVFERGGWLAAFQNTVGRAYTIAKIGALIMGAGALGMFFWR